MSDLYMDTDIDLVRVLRNCARDGSCFGCPYADSHKDGAACINAVMLDTADAIEWLMAVIVGGEQ